MTESVPPREQHGFRAVFMRCFEFRSGDSLREAECETDKEVRSRKYLSPPPPRRQEGIRHSVPSAAERAKKAAAF
jgi:hypothetical protein